MFQHQFGALRTRKGGLSVDDKGRDAIQAASVRCGFGFGHVVGALASGQERNRPFLVDTRGCCDLGENRLVANVPTFDEIRAEQSLDHHVLDAFLIGKPDKAMSV